MEVFNEIQKQDDKLADWCQSHKTMFVYNEKDILRIVIEVVRKYPSLVNPAKDTPDADPFVIALAKVRQIGTVTNDEIIVVTEERLSNKIRIPFVCKD